MKYRVEYGRGAVKSLKSVSAGTRDLIMGKVDALAEDPFALNPNVRKLLGRPEYRLRVGNWRVLYILRHNTLIFCVLKVGTRGGFYV